MAAPGGETATRILDIAERHLMRRGGYHAFSYRDIAEELAVKSAAIHYHFPAKADLVAAVLDRYRARFRRWGDAQSGTPGEQLEAYLGLSRALLADRRIDPFGTLAAEYDTLPAPVQERMKGLHAEIFGWVAGLLARGRDAGVFRFAGAPSAKAAELACALLGAQQVGRVLGGEAFEEVAREVCRSIGVEVP